MTDMETEMMPDFDPSAFMTGTAQEPEVVTGKVKKNKRKSRAEPYSKPNDEEMAALRKKAESMCSSYEQYKIVKKYKKDRLQDWVQQHEFNRDTTLRNNVFDFFHKGYAKALDIVTGGGGHVQEQITNDLSLRTAMEDEGRDFVKYLSNKAKLVMLSLSDVASGKMDQSLKKQNEGPVIEEISGDGEAEEGANTDNNQTSCGFRDFLGPSRKTEEEEDPRAKNNLLSLSEGEESMQATTETVPCDPEGEATRNYLGREEGEREDGDDGEAVEMS